MYLINLCSTNPRQQITRCMFQKLLLTVSLLFLGLSSFPVSAVYSSLIFDSANDRYIDTANAPFQLPNGTWEAWFQVSTLNSLQAIMSKDEPLYNDDGWLGVASNNKIYFYIDKSGESSAREVYSNTTITTGTWYHVAVTWGSGGMKMYVGGVQQSQTNGVTSGIVSSGTNLRIGARNAFGDYNYFNGQIDEVRVWNVARTQAQIDQYKGVALTGSESGLLAYYRLDENLGSTTADSAGGDQNGTLVNNPAWAVTSETTPVVYPPTTQASAINFTSKTATTMTVNWTNGNGASRIVLMRSGSAVSSLPFMTIGYTANAAFGSGTQLGTGNYVVYQGTGSSVVVTGLTANTTYTKSENYNSHIVKLVRVIKGLRKPNSVE